MTDLPTPADNDFANLPKWDLSDFYAHARDPKIDQDIQTLHQKVADFQKYKGTLHDHLHTLYDALLAYEDMSQDLGALGSYAYLNYATQMTDEGAQAFLQKISELETDISTQTLFFTLEVIALSDEALEQAYQMTPKLRGYTAWFDHVRLYKKHTLTAESETILTQKDLTSRSSWVRLYDQTLAEMTFTDGEETLNLSQVLEKMSHKDAAVREAGANMLAHGLREKKSLLLLVFNTLLKDKDIQDNLRSYAHPWTSRHMANGITDEVVDALVQSAQKTYSLCHRYYAWKAKDMGVEKLQYWDRNAPLTGADDSADQTYTWEESKRIVRDAYHDFSPKLAEVGQLFFDHPWIDVPAYQGKTSGAFAHPTTPNKHPYLMLNFLGKRRDVMTLAHELGHGVHQYLANGQPPLLVGTPLTVAETASVFGEMLTFQAMLRSAKAQGAAGHEAAKILLASKIEDMINTVYRQIAFHTFEVFLHQERKKGELSYQQISDAWLSTQRDALGDAVVLDETAQGFWGYISHFIHVPFYVYAYAFGDCLVNSLYNVYRKGDVKDFEAKYLELLSKGGSEPYDKLLEPFGLDPKDPDFWMQGLSLIQEFMDELESYG